MVTTMVTIKLTTTMVTIILITTTIIIKDGPDCMPSPYQPNQKAG